MDTQSGDNLRQFDEIAAEYFARLYAAFPFEQILTPVAENAKSYVSFTVEEGHNYSAFEEEISQAREQLEGIISRIPIRDATLSWLHATGYFFADEEKGSFEPSIHFLTNEGIPAKNVFKNSAWDEVKVGRRSFKVYKHARLSPKGFEALRSAPLGDLANLIGADKSLGRALTDEMGKAASEAKKQVISRVVGEVIGHAIKAIST